MAQTHKPFRELLKPGTNFEFVGRTRVWLMVSAILVIASVGMLFVNKSMRGGYLNWTTDFAGGTELIFEKFQTDGNAIPPNVGAVRAALKDAGEVGVDVSDISWADEDGVIHNGLIIRSPRYGALDKETIAAVQSGIATTFKEQEVIKVSPSGDRFFLRSKKPLNEKALRDFFATLKLEMKPWSAEDVVTYSTVQEGTGEYNAEAFLRGLDAQIEALLEKGLGEGTDVRLVQAYGIGAKAGARLRNDGMKSLFYAILLIMLYLAFRFDIRYAPGAVVALLHDAILVVGVFAVTWTEVSLTSVAALLTVIGYSVNDTVVIFDRIRENVARLKDKKLARVINISLNETLSRTLLTSLTLFVVTLMMNILGTGLVSNFAFAMNIGVIVGVYSSVFVASPILLFINDKYYSKRAKKK